MTLTATLGPCTRDPAHGVAEVPWSGERLCWDCTDADLDLLAKATELDTPVQAGGFGLGTLYVRPAGESAPSHTWTTDDAAEAVAGLYLAAANGDPELAAELVRESEYLKRAVA